MLIEQLVHAITPVRLDTLPGIAVSTAAVAATTWRRRTVEIRKEITASVSPIRSEPIDHSRRLPQRVQPAKVVCHVGVESIGRGEGNVKAIAGGDDAGRRAAWKRASRRRRRADEDAAAGRHRG
jgi:hypothetical protein